MRGNKKYSILADHLGTPIEMYQDDGSLFWERQLNANRKTIKETQQGSCPFLFQGQYYDAEIELAYNRFRYYDPEDGKYISQDPIGLLSGEFGFYNYVEDTNEWVDVFGLKKSYNPKFGDFKKHHRKHGEGITSKQYRKHALNNIKNGKRFKVTHDGKTKYVYVTRTGEDTFAFTSTNLSGNRIYTHMPEGTVTTKYLSNSGITLPKEF